MQSLIEKKQEIKGSLKGLPVEKRWHLFENAASLDERAIYLCSIFTAGPKNQNKNWQMDPDVPFYGWMQSLSKRNQVPLYNWVTPLIFNQVAAYFLWLYNKDFGHTRRICERLVNTSEDAPPYLSLLIFNALSRRLSAAHINQLLVGPSEGWEPVIQELVASDWFDEFLDQCTQPLRFYGGGTNTVLGIYDRHFRDWQNDAILNYRAECQYDLGGGFATSNLNRISGLDLTSCDILNPDFSQLDKRLIIRRKVGDFSFLLTDEEKEAYIDQQRKVRWNKWNVTDPNCGFDDSHRSYVFTSTGFLTSTVRPLESIQDGLTHVDTSLLATYRIMELVEQGKDVSIFLVQRAILSHRTYKTIKLRFKNGKLVAKELSPNLNKKDYLQQSAFDFASNKIMAPSFAWN